VTLSGGKCPKVGESSERNGSERNRNLPRVEKLYFTKMVTSAPIP